jgi:site-specific recombinase XerD
MQRRHSALTETQDTLLTDDLPRLIEDWLMDCQLRQHSHRTIQGRRDFLLKLLWFLKHKGEAEISTPQIRAFIHYLSEGHKDPLGRWGNPRLIKPLKPVTIHDFYRVLRAFFNWLIMEELLSDSPMRRVKAPVVRLEQKHPLTPPQVTALIQAAKRSTDSKRNESLMLLLLDTGLRASEVCSLKVEDVDFSTNSFKVTGKGNKPRLCYFGRSTSKVLGAYLRIRKAQPYEPLFAARGGGSLSANSLLQLTTRLAKAAGISPGLCSPHALRRTFAVSLLRNGGNVFALQAMLGHTDLQMTRRYVAIADADIEAQHRQFSPMDRLQIK